MELELFERDPMVDAVELLHNATGWYTAEPIVDSLLTMLGWQEATGKKLCDPSAGDGAFLGAALRLLLTTNPSLSDDSIAEAVTGWEIHHFAAEEARHRLKRILMEQGGRTGPRASAMAARMVRTGDFLTDGPRSPSLDLVAGNPPFLRYAHIPEILRTVYERELPGEFQNDMMHSFIGRMSQCMRQGGQVGLVIADRFLFSEGAAGLRDIVGRKFGIAHIERLDSASAFYRAKNRRAGQPPRISPVAIVLKDGGTGLRPLDKRPIFPDALDDIDAGGPTLESIATIRLAPWLGPHGIFVVNGATAARLPREVLVPAIDTDDIKNGVMSKPTKYAIRTSRSEEPCRAVMEHLESQLHLMPSSKQRTTMRWLPPESFERMDLSRPSLLVPRIAKSLRPVRIPAGVLPLDHGLSVVSAGAATLDEIEAVLTSEKANDWVRRRAPRLENGFHSLTTSMLRTLPVPEHLAGRGEAPEGQRAGGVDPDGERSRARRSV